jgi:hypothetical protein
MLDKKWYVSKTFWFNVVALILVVVASFGYGDFDPDPKIYEYGGMLVTLINIGLRFVTKKGVRI